MKRFLTFSCLVLVALFAIYFLSKTRVHPSNEMEKTVGDNLAASRRLQSSQTVSGTSQIQQPPLNLSASVTDVPVSVQDYLRRKMADPQYDWKQPINFYGRVVDENGEPVAGASADFVWTDISPNGSSEAHTTSDSVGFFSLLNGAGKRLQVTVSKQGYYTPKGEKLSSFEYANPGDGLFKPDQGNPRVFHLRKKDGGADLVRQEKEITVGVGKVASLQLDRQTELQVELLTNAPMYAKQWAAHVTIVNGGIQPALDEFPFEAPLEGYQTEMNLDRDTPKPPTWMSLYQGGQFYVKTKTGYGRMELRMISGKTFMLVSIILNTTGSQNLEPK